MNSFARIANGREDWTANASVPLHCHDQAYAAIVLSGSYEECGSRGRFRVGPGDVLSHAAFDAHLNRFQKTGAQILNLIVDATGFSVGHIDDPDAIARTAERDPVEAGGCLRAQLRETRQEPGDWQDALAFDLLDDPDCRLDAWAADHNLAPETLSRGFRKMFGVTPARFRSEARTRRALALIARTDMPLASVAAMTGFADQAHMSRALHALTGSPPRCWRRSNRFKTHAPDFG
jgi:AraC-like DNA-binding protein